MSYDHRSYERNCINCAHNCDDHSLLDSKSAVQYMKHFIYHFKHVFLRCFKVEANVSEPEIEKAKVQARVPERNSQVFNLSNCSVVFKNLTVLVK